MPRVLLYRFLTVIERHFGKRIKKSDKSACLLIEQFQSQLENDTTEFDFPLLASCSELHHLMDTICNIYHVLMTLQLRLFWKLQIFKRLMKSGNAVAQNVNDFTQACDRWDEKCHRSSDIDKSTFLTWTAFRKDLKRKCECSYLY